MKIDETLGYEEISELISALQVRKLELSAAYFEEIDKKSQENWEKRQKQQKDFQKNQLPKIKKYLTVHLCGGDIIKVKGARDGKGIREFLGWSEYGKTLECRQIIVRCNYNSRSKEFVEIESRGQITQHMVDKVTHVKIGDNFVKITDLIGKIS